jgi:polyisoprenoid-binding protein YceI
VQEILIDGSELVGEHFVEPVDDLAVALHASIVRQEPPGYLGPPLTGRFHAGSPGPAQNYRNVMRLAIALFTLAMLQPAAPALGAQPETWSVDPVHSTAQFTARHFGIVPVIGTIPLLSASVKLNSGEQVPVAITAEFDPSKVDTHNDMRDSDLRSAHFFDVPAFPTMRFVSTKIEGDAKHFTVAGDLSMHGQTHAVTLSAQVAGAGKSPRGRSIVAYAVTVTIDRTQWGMSYGPMIVGNDIDISVNVEADAP